MINIQYYKGQRCVVNALLCQEGYCSECEISIRSTKSSEDGLLDLSKTGRRVIHESESGLIAACR